MSTITFYSAGADSQADVAFGKKALGVWKENCVRLNRRIITRVADESFTLTTKRPVQVTTSFKRSGHRELLRDFLATMQEKIGQFETTLEQDIKTRGVEQWYPPLAALGLASFVGAEWIVITPRIVSEIKGAVAISARKLFRADKFGFNLKRQTKHNRREIKQICRNCKKKFLDDFQLQFDLETLPVTWEELRARKAYILKAARAAHASLTDAINSCQAQIDNFILASNDDQSLVEAIALRVERENYHGDMPLAVSLSTAYRKERDALKSEFISEVKNQSVSAAKQTEKTLGLEALTASFSSRLSFVENKYRLINDLQAAYKKDLQGLAKKEFDSSTQSLFERNKHVFNIAHTNVMRERILVQLRSKLQEIQKGHVQQLLSMPVTTSEELVAFTQAYEACKTKAEIVRDTSLGQLATGGMTSSDWDHRLADFKDEIVGLIDRELAELKRLGASIDNNDEKAINTALVDHLHQQGNDFVESFDNMIKELARELARSNISDYEHVFARYTGEEIAPSLSEYLTSTGKLPKRLSSMMQQLSAVRSVINCVYTTRQQLKNLKASLLAFFPQQTGAINDAFDGFVMQSDKSRATALSSYRRIEAVTHTIFRNEADSLTLLIAAIITEIKANHQDINELDVTIHDITTMKWFIFYVERVHDGILTQDIRKFLVRILRSEKIKIRFGAQKFYRELLNDLGKSAARKTTGLEPKEISVDRSEVTSSTAHSGVVGIPNIGNTCFANVSLQALARMSTWTKRRQVYGGKFYKRASPNVKEFCTMTQSLVEMVQRGDESGIKGKLVPLFNLAYTILPNLIGQEQGQQQDAHEFFSHLVESLGIREPGFELPMTFKSSRIIKKKSDDAQGEYTELVPMHELVLPLKSTIKKAMHAWMDAEPFEREGAGIMYTQMMIYDPPDIMTIVIARFAAGRKLNTAMKISDLTIPFYQHNNPAGLRAVTKIGYKLVGGIYHNGKTPRSGHYYFIDHTTGIVYDDNATYKIDLLDEKIIQKQSYILFFQKVAR